MAAICLRGSTLVVTTEGEVPIREIRAGHRVLDAQGGQVEVHFNILGGTSRHFVKIETGALGAASPSQDLFLTDGHPLWVDGREITAAGLVGRPGVTRVVLPEEEMVYSLATSERVFVTMQGALVCTWSENRFAGFCAANKVVFATR